MTTGTWHDCLAYTLIGKTGAERTDMHALFRLSESRFIERD